jgi:cohesin complex subunit SCC1
LQAIEVSEGEEEEEEEDLPPAVELFQSGDQEQEAQGGSTDAAATTFTANTRAVLKHVRGLAERQVARASGGGGGVRSAKADIVGLNRLVAGKKRLDASRWFFEMLVLKSKDYVELEQKEPYGDIKIRAGAKLLSAR